MWGKCEADADLLRGWRARDNTRLWLMEPF